MSATNRADSIAVGTGAGRGLGLAIAQRLAADGYAVAVTDSAPTGAGDTARSNTMNGHP